MAQLNSNNPAFNAKSGKKGFYFTEILMLKSIVVLLILTFFLLNEMQASNYENNSLRNDISSKQMNQDNDELLK